MKWVKRVTVGLMFWPGLGFAEGPTNVPALPESVDLSSFYAYAGVIIAALVGMIVYRKAVKITNRYS